MKILIFRPASIGDCLMAKYFMENVRAAYPDVRCAVAVGTRVAMVRDLYEAYSWLEVLEVNKYSPAPLFAGGRWDAIVTSYTSGGFGLLPKIAARLAARRLVGWADRSPLNSLLYNTVLPLMGRTRSPRLLETDALRALGVPVKIERPTFAYVPQPRLLSRLGLEGKRYVVLHLFSGSDARGVSPVRRREHIQALRQALSADVMVVVTGSDTERSSLGELPMGVIPAGTTVQELAHLINQSVCVVSLDTGAGHLAAHLGKSLIILSSCPGAAWWAPEQYGADIPTVFFCNIGACGGVHRGGPYPPCLESLYPAQVAESARLICDRT